MERSSGSEVGRSATHKKGRPRNLKREEELIIAVFIQTRVLEARSVVNAIEDACKRFRISRATAYRINREKKQRAIYLANMLRRADRKVFRRVATTRHSVNNRMFDDWSRDGK